MHWFLYPKLSGRNFQILGRFFRIRLKFLDSGFPNKSGKETQKRPRIGSMPEDKYPIMEIMEITQYILKLEYKQNTQ